MPDGDRLEIEAVLARFDAAAADAARVEAVREEYKTVAAELCVLLRPGRYTSLALTALEESAMWATKAITHS